MTAVVERTDTGLDAFRREVEHWFQLHADVEGWVRGSTSFIRPDSDDAHAEARGRRAQGLLFEAGLAGISWPQEYGGRGLGIREQLVFNEVVASYDVPLAQYVIGLGMCGPTLLALGTEQQRERYLRPMLRGEEIWCQCFSEPEAGSDVAALRMTAVRDVAGWRLQGQKVWTSGAQRCRFGLVLARTNPDVPKHRGLSMFIVDLTSPGVTIRPIRQIDGRAHFNELFLDDVLVPEANVVGAVDQGWQAAITTLMNERVALGGLRTMDEVPSARHLAELAAARCRLDDPVVRQELAALLTKERLVKLLADRVTATVLAGGVTGAEGSVVKLLRGQYCRASALLGARLAGAEASAWPADDPELAQWAETLLYVPAVSLAGGTDEIQRNILGERVLGLPREPLP